MLPKRCSSMNTLRNAIGTDNWFLLCSSPKSIKFQNIRKLSAVSSLLNEEKSKVFFSSEAQKLMKKITGFDIEKVYRRRAIGGGKIVPPKYEFMTNEQLKEAQENAIRRAYSKLHIPPLVPLNKKEIEIIDNEPRMLGFTRSNYVFTDISYNVSDKKRNIFVRQPDGVLRKALPYERHRMNELYFPRTGRSYEHPKMFQKENLRRILDEGHYEFVLNRACVQFEPDDEEFHDALFATFEKINEKKAFNELRSTRHFGSMTFYLCLTKNVNKLIEEMLETERFHDAVNVAELYSLIHPNSKFNSLNIDPDNKVEYLRIFIECECPSPEMSLQLLETYWEAQKAPINANVG